MVRNGCLRERSLPAEGMGSRTLWQILRQSLKSLGINCLSSYWCFLNVFDCDNLWESWSWKFCLLVCICGARVASPHYYPLPHPFRASELNMSIGQVSPYRDRRCNICCMPKPFTLLWQEVKQKAKIKIYI